MTGPSYFALAVENAIARAAAELETASTDHVNDVDSSFPRSKLSDAEGGEIFLTESDPPTNLRFRQDMNRVGDCGVNGDGTFIQTNGSNVLIYAPWYVIGLDDNDNTIAAYVDIKARPGQRFRLNLAGVGFPGEGSADGAGAKVLCRESGHYLTKTDYSVPRAIEQEEGPNFNEVYSSLQQFEWADADPGQYALWNWKGATDVTGPESYTIDFQVEDIVTCKGADEVTLRIYLYSPPQTDESGNHQTVYDSFSRLQLIPQFNLAALVGHNIAGSVTALVQVSGGYTLDNLWAELDTDDEETWGRPALEIADEFLWQTLKTMTIDRPMFYGLLDEPIFPRYVRLYLEGTTMEHVWAGELFFGYAEQLLRDQRWGAKTTDELKQVRHTNDAGMTRAQQVSSGIMRGMEMEFITDHQDDENDGERRQLEQIRRYLIARAGTTPVFFIPDSSKPTILFGLVPDKLSSAEVEDVADQLSLEIEPLPMPLVGL